MSTRCMKLRVLVPSSVKRYAYTFPDGSTRMRRKAFIFVVTVRWVGRR